MYFDMELIYFDVLDTEQISLKIIDVTLCSTVILIVKFIML